MVGRRAGKNTMSNTTLPTLAIDLGAKGAPVKPLHGLNRIDPPSAWFDNLSKPS